MAGEPPGVVVCDMGMPTHDGRWLARRLLSVCPDTSVVMYSEAADMDAARFCITHGVVDYLVKPFAREHLRESLRLGAEAWRDSVRARGRRAQAERALRERMAAVKRILAAGSQSEADIDALLASAIAEDPCAVRRARRVSPGCGAYVSPRLLSSVRQRGCRRSAGVTSPVKVSRMQNCGTMRATSIPSDSRSCRKPSTHVRGWLMPLRSSGRPTSGSTDAGVPADCGQTRFRLAHGSLPRPSRSTPRSTPRAIGGHEVRPKRSSSFSGSAGRISTRRW